MANLRTGDLEQIFTPNKLTDFLIYFRKNKNNR